MTRKQILKLKPEFKFGQMTMVEWFEITEGDTYCIIRSGLNHADGKTKSPFYYNEGVFGKNAAKKSIQKFTDWWSNLKIETPESEATLLGLGMSNEQLFKMK